MVLSTNIDGEFSYVYMKNSIVKNLSDFMNKKYCKINFVYLLFWLLNPFSIFLILFIVFISGC